MMAAQGGCSLVAQNEDEAIGAALKLLSLLPGSNAEDPELLDGDDLNRLLPAIEPSDTGALLSQVLDTGTMVELMPAYEESMITAMGRIAGRSVGIVATANEYLTAGALQKAARFVHFMDCFNLPVVSFINTRGVKVDSLNTQSWLMNAQSQLLYAYATATVPKLAVVTGDAIGQAYIAMGGKAASDVTLAWPGAVISALTPEAAVSVLYADEVSADKDNTPEVSRAKVCQGVYRDCGERSGRGQGRAAWTILSIPPKRANFWLQHLKCLPPSAITIPLKSTAICRCSDRKGSIP